MSGLTEFLLARIAEDEESARAASRAVGGDHWRSESDPGDHCNIVTVRADRDLSSINLGCGDYHNDGEVKADHIIRHDPARVLAECEAKRRIVEELRAAEVEWGASRGPQEGGEVNGLSRAVALLAAVDADHPDFREEWRP